MGNIFNTNNQKLAVIRDDGTIWSTSGSKFGHISADHIYDKEGNKAGYMDANGHVFNVSGSHIGTVQNTGGVHDIEGHHVGKVVGDHMEMGGAALLLLVR
jgi:hypothetical protein